MLLAALAITTALVLPKTARAVPERHAQCLHDPATETPDQRARRVQAVGLARTVNSAEATFSAQSGTQTYGDLDQLVAHNMLKAAPPSGQYVVGFDLHLDVLEKRYWFEVVDTTDSCGFRFISNQKGLIFTAEPIQ
jgi:hypothetical protein